MKGWVLDTNVISELRRPNPNRSVVAWVSETASEELFTSVVCIAEIRHGIHMTSEMTKVLALENWLVNEVRPFFDDRILPVTEDCLVVWRRLAESAERNRKPAPAADLLIAATARHHSLAVATRDTAPFIAAGVPVLNPFTGERFGGA